MPAKTPQHKKSLVPLSRKDLPIDTTSLARYLIGKTLVRETPQGRMTARIVETEAYLLGDAASHGYRGETKRNHSLFLERGHAYVYFIYGMHYALNVSAGKKGQGTGILIRAAEPLEGIAQMQKNRGTNDPHELTKGPGRLAQALKINKQEDGADLCKKGPLYLAQAQSPTAEIKTTKRIGITKEAHRLLRFHEKGNKHTSGPKHLNK
jgi:DNA-3-methyladenine glycosylase